MVWFYYNWGFTTFPILVLLWWLLKLLPQSPQLEPRLLPIRDMPR
jgi:hypothetical protein